MSHELSKPETADELMTDHSYDGIQEYDNPLPGWWTFLFWLTAVFALPYWAWFHMGTPGRSMFDEYNNETSHYLNLKFAELGELEPTRENILKYMQDDKWIKVGIATYQANCVSCHGQNGEGVVGPNLTDDVYKNVKQIEDLITVIEKGANNGAMPAWGKRFSHPNVAILTAAYIASMRGKNEAGRQPEGNPIPPWPDK